MPSRIIAKPERVTSMAWGMINVCLKAEDAAFKAFVPDRKSIAVPIEDFHKRVMAVKKDEQIVGKRLGFKNIANDAEQTIEGLSHVD